MSNPVFFRIVARPIGAICLIAILAAILYLPGIGTRDFWAPDEPHFAQVAREMLRSGDFVVPRFNGTPVARKPPLIYWMAVISSYPTGQVTEATARFPVALFALVALLATYWLGTRLFGHWEGLSAAAILATSVLFLHQARWLQTDMYLLAAVTWASALLHRAYQSKHRFAWFAAAGVAAGAGVLAKGPLGLIIPVLVVGGLTAAERNWRVLVHPGLLLSLGLGLVVSLPWYVLVYGAAGTEFVQEVVIKHNFGRFYGSWSHPQPFYYHAVHLLWGFAPWTLLLPSVLLCALRCDFLGTSRESAAARFLLAWTLILFVFFSLASGEQAKYLLPAYPALAILVGRLLCDAGAVAVSLRSTRWVVVPAAMLSAALAVTGALLPLLAWKLEPSLLSAAGATAILLVTSGWFALMQLRARNMQRTATVWIATIAFIAVLAGNTVLPVFNRWKSYRGVAERAIALAGADGRIAVYGIYTNQVGGLVYYADRPLYVLEPESLEEALAFVRSGQQGVMITTTGGHRRLSAQEGSRLHVIAEARVGHRSLILIGTPSGQR